MKTTLAAVFVGAGLLLATRPLVAHHAFAAEFGAGKPVQPEFDEMEIRRLT